MKYFLSKILSISQRYFGVVLLLGVLVLLSNCGDGDEKVAPAEQALTIKALKVVRSDIPLTMEFVGQTKGAIDAEVRSRVEGVVTGIEFEEGKEVKEGQTLYTIDPAPYNAKVAEAQGKLAEAETMLVKATSDLSRIRPLVKMKAMSERDLDRAVAQEGAARGSVDAAKAALEAAKIELSYCNVTAPTTGVIGLTKAKVGEFVGRAPNPVVLNTVSKLDPIHVKFAISENDYLYFMRIRERQLQNGQTPAKRELRMVLADGSEYSESGYVTSLERAVDSSTGTIPVEAAFPNEHQLLRPGQFAKIKTISETRTGAVVIPRKALRELQGQFQALVIKSDNRIEVRTVALGPVVGEQQIIEKGLEAGDQIAIDGIQRLKEGMLVSPQF